MTEPGLCHCMSCSHLDTPVGAPRRLVNRSSSGGAGEEAHRAVRLSGRCRASSARAEAPALSRWRRSSREQGRRPGLQVRGLPGRCVRGLQTGSGHDITAAQSCSSTGHDDVYKHPRSYGTGEYGGVCNMRGASFSCVVGVTRKVGRYPGGCTTGSTVAFPLRIPPNHSKDRFRGPTDPTLA